jgi:cardiolipin synthase A/B
MLTPFMVGVLSVVQVALILRVLVRRGSHPPVRLAWIMVIGLVPLLGILLYLLFGEIRLAQANRHRMRHAREKLLMGWHSLPEPVAEVHPRAATAFATGKATGGFAPTGGNRAHLLPEGDDQIEDIIAAIDAATESVHLLFYIWLPDDIGTRVARAAMRAAARGVAVRVLVDDLGSRALIRSPLWPAMADAGVEAARAFPFSNPLVGSLFQRIDLRNHRKIAVIDNRVAWSGSRNCADAAFRVKARFAPWVDVLMRIEGPVVRQMQAVFLQDWMTYSHVDLSPLLTTAPPPLPDGFVAQVIATGPDQSPTGLSDTIVALIHAATHRLTVTTPYYVPDIPPQTALCAAALRGVATTLILPENNDSRIVGAASESHYAELLDAGVRIMHFRPGLLHSKIVTVDGRFALLGSTNIDRRSFNLNYENSMLLDCPQVTAELDALQDSYIARSREVTPGEVANWSVLRRIRNNSVALAEPLL